MNDDIKEILNRLDFNEWEIALYKVPITWSELYTIRDYITNLQQELEKRNTYIKYLEEYNPKYYKGEKFYGRSDE